MQKNYTVKDLPDSEKPYERCFEYGPGVLTDAELIAVIIKSGSVGERSIDLAQRILSSGPNGLLNIYNMTIAQLMEIRGVGKVKAIQLKCIGELSKRIAMRSRIEDMILTDPDSVAMYYMEKMRHENKEFTVAAYFDSKHMLISDKTLSIGTSNMALISPFDIFKYALECNAQYFILLHNHPSGNPSPSREDCDITQRLIDGGRLMGITMVDHIIIGDNKYYSFREQNKLQ